MKNIEKCINKALLPEEKVVWTGRPKIRAIFHSMDWIFVLFGLCMIFACYIVGYLAIGNLNYVIRVSTSVPLAYYFPFVIVIPFFIFALYLVIGRKITMIFVKKNTIYVITNMRVIIVNKCFGAKFRSIENTKIKSVKSLIKKSGYGSIYINIKPFRLKSIFDLMLEIPWLYFRSKKFILFDIGEAEKVNKIIDESCSNLLR